MTALQSMINSTQPLGVYNLAESSLVYKELSVYATVLDRLTEQISTLEKEIFVQTATDFGLSSWEEIWGLPRTDLSNEKRREMIMSRCSLNYNDFTPLSLSKLFNAIAFPATFVEDAEHFCLYISSDKSKYSMPQRQWIAQEIEEFIPAHLQVYIDFRTIDWDDIDNKKHTFYTMDGMGYTWEEIESYSV